MKLFFIRHGETEGNVKKLVMGQTDFPLTDVGREQATQLKKYLVNNAFNWELCYTSPLSRALETTRILNFIKHDIVVVPDIIEIDVGSASNVVCDFFVSENPKYLNLGAFPDEQYPGGGESLNQFYKRCTEWLKTSVLIKENSIKNIMIVGHAGYINVSMHYIFKLPLSNYQAFSLKHASLTEVHILFEDGFIKPSLKAFNGT